MDFHSRYHYNPKTDLIGRGGFAKVYKGYDTIRDCAVALKFFKSDVSEKYNLLSEIKRVINLEHPNICRYYDVAVLQGANFMGEEERTEVGIMEYMDSGDIRTYIKQHPQHRDKLLKDVLHGLAFLHQKHLIHRDLKPNNILIKNTPTSPVAKITDFGISKAVGSATTTKSSELLGTIEFMAPEQLSPNKYGINAKLSTNVDLWSWGCLAYEIIRGESLFGSREKGEDTEQILNNIFCEDYTQEIDLLPEPYRQALQLCLVKDANRRVKKAEEVIAVLEGKKYKDLDEEHPNFPHQSEVTEVIDYSKANTAEKNSDLKMIKLYELIAIAQNKLGVYKRPNFIPDWHESLFAYKQKELQEIATSLDQVLCWPGWKSANEKDDIDKLVNEYKFEKNVMDRLKNFFSRYRFNSKTDLIKGGQNDQTYKAYDTTYRYPVALKFYSPWQELFCQTGLEHPNLCKSFEMLTLTKMETIWESHDDGSTIVDIMEFIDGGNILTFVKGHPQHRDKLLKDVLYGLTYLHNNEIRQIIHKKIRPNRILIKNTAKGPVAKIIGFRVTNNEYHTTIMSEFDFSYSSPEKFKPAQFGVDGKLSFNCDLWSWGCLVYQLITGNPLFGKDPDNVHQVMNSVLHQNYERKISKLPEPYRTALSLCLVRDANKRVQSADDLIAIL